MSEPTPTDSEAFRRAFRRHAAGVAVVTTLDPEGGPVGFTATSLASVAADPPLASFSLARSASSWPAIESAERVIVHLMGARNRELAQRLAGPAEQRFAGEHWSAGPHGLPLLHDVTAWMLGRIVSRTPAGGSALVLVHVESGAEGADDAPLLYHQRRWHTPGEIV